jgi:hypothetical protein
VAQPLRGTQSLVGQMGWVFARPWLTLLEVAWRWLFGAPLLLICWAQAQRILAAVPPESAGLAGINLQNPWIAAVQLSGAWATYRPHVAAVLVWLALPAALGWAVLSGLGRGLLFKRMEPGAAFRPFTMIALQAVWLLALAAVWWGWASSAAWVAATHITPGAEPDLVGYSVWMIFLSLGDFTLWALVSWVFTIAPLLALVEGGSPLAALGRAARVSRTFRGRLVEINLVMGIVKLALMVVAMVFSSVLIPFSDEVGMSALHLEWVVVGVFYFVANDYFQVVRLKGFVEFWKMERGDEPSA